MTTLNIDELHRQAEVLVHEAGTESEALMKGRGYCSVTGIVGREDAVTTARRYLRDRHLWVKATVAEGGFIVWAREEA